MLEDIAILTGGTGHLRGRSASSWTTTTVEQLGQARRVTVTKDDTTIVEGAGKAELIQARIKQIKAQIEETTSRLRQGEAAGAAGQARRRRRRHQGRRRHRGRAEGEEAPHRGRAQATRAAVEEGIVAGGGIALLNAQKKLDGGLGRRTTR